MVVKVDDDVLQAIASAEIGDDYVQLTGQLDPKLYKRVAKALEACGFTWNRKAGKHLGKGADVVEQLVNTGEYTDAKKEFEAFYTPPDLAMRVLDAAGLLIDGPRLEVLEPSAGVGALATPPRLRGHEVFCIEKDPKACDLLLASGFDDEHVRCWDFLKMHAGDKLAASWQSRVDRVVMNPPFSRCQDALHVMHAMEFLKPGGRLVAIMSPGVTFRQDKPYAQLRNIGGFTVEALPDNSFASSGTNVRTVMLVFDKAS